LLEFIDDERSEDVEHASPTIPATGNQVASSDVTAIDRSSLTTSICTGSATVAAAVDFVCTAISNRECA